MSAVESSAADLHIAARELDTRELAYLHLVNPAAAALQSGSPPDPLALRMLRQRGEAPKACVDESWR